MWVRGLKPLWLSGLRLPTLVAPYVGAWIETEICKSQVRNTESHPMWVRGLKL